MGQHFLYSELQDKICESIRGGLSIDGVCKKFHISRTNFYEWRVKGREENNEPYTSFNNAIDSALAHLEETCVNDILADGDGNLKKWILQARFRDEYSQYRTIRKYDLGLSGMTYTDQMSAVLDKVDTGEISGEEAFRLSDIISRAAKVDEITDLKRRVEELEIGKG